VAHANRKSQSENSKELATFKGVSIGRTPFHAALGFYYDHRSDMDTQILRSVKDVEDLRVQAGESPIRNRLHRRLNQVFGGPSRLGVGITSTNG
jgi:hypothetical protein